MSAITFNLKLLQMPLIRIHAGGRFIWSIALGWTSNIALGWT